MGAKFISLIYVSIASKDLDEGELLKILEISRANNERDSITGMLLYKEGNFMQVLEGPEDNVLARYESIRRDTRHKDIYLLSVQPIRAREFPRWEMGFANIDQIDVASLPNYSPFLEEGFDSDAFLDEPSRAKTSTTGLCSISKSGSSRPSGLFRPQSKKPEREKAYRLPNSPQSVWKRPPSIMWFLGEYLGSSRTSRWRSRRWRDSR